MNEKFREDASTIQVDTSYIVDIIKYLQTKKDEYQQYHALKLNERNSAQQQILTYLSLFLSVLVLFISISMPIVTTTFATYSNTFNQQFSNILPLSQMNRSYTAELLLNATSCALDNSATGYVTSINLFANIYKYTGIFLGLGILFFVLFSLINTWSYNKKLNMLLEKILDLDGCLTYLYDIKIEYKFKLADRHTQEILKQFYLPEKEYCDKLRLLIRSWVMNNETKNEIRSD